MAPLISFAGVSKSFHGATGTVDAITDVSFDIAPGEFVTVIGPSGCGKSTLLNMTAGLFQPSAGSVRYNGDEVTRINPRTGYMTQNDHLLPWRDVAGNIAVPLEIAGMGKADRARRVAHLVGLVGLHGFERSYPSQLSGGMKKRAALARLLAYDPDTLLMDEPFAALDAQLRIRMQNEVLHLCRQLGKTALFVTHDLDEAAALGDRVMLFSGRPGRLRTVIASALGRNRDLYDLRRNPEFVRMTGELWELMAAREMVEA